MLDLHRVPYSVCGSFLAWDLRGRALTLISVRGGECLPVIEIPCPDETFWLTPWELTASGENREMKFCLYGTDGTYILGSGNAVNVRWLNLGSKFGYVTEHPDGRVEICAGARRCIDVFFPLRGKIETRALREEGSMGCTDISLRFIPDESGIFEIAAEQKFFDADCLAFEEHPYEAQKAELERGFRSWAEKLGCRSDYDRECAYILWSNTVPAGGLYSAPAIVMSKTAMANVWSWDNAFNALALAECCPETALEQFLLVYRAINGAGRVPDCISETRMIWNFVKPPVQGWIYRRMMQKNKYFTLRSVIEKVYFYMKRNTDWWLNCRGDTPCYYHGNDSGEDNSTCFDLCEQISTPELLAFLSVQCGLLSEMAQRLYMAADAKVYRMHADTLAERAVRDYWDGGKLFVLRMDTREPYYCSALMPLRLIVLEDRLPAEIKEYIIGQLSRFTGAAGLASEALDSPAFEEDGYWRGAAWAPDQIFFCTALQDMGYAELASRIAENYKRALEKNGFHENISAKTGAGLRCKGYTWTANAYMLL